jgi:thiol:disulfide interchange protein DsbG
MRALLLCTIFGALSGAAHAAASQCALPNGGPIQVADRQVQAAPAASATQPTPPQPALSAGNTTLPSSLASVPFVQHVTGAGAVVSDLGSSHVMRSIAARNGDQFMIFQITPDSQAAVSGALTELTAAQLNAAAASGNVTPLPSQHGLDAVFVRSGAQFQVFYVTPDKARVIPGVLWDSAGKDLTRDQVANVPGAIPTVTVGDVPSGKVGAGAGPAVAALPLVQKASFGTVGPASVARQSG